MAGERSSGEVEFPFAFYCVLPRLFVARQPRDARDVSEMARAGITHVEVLRHVGNDAQLYSNRGLSNLWNGIPADVEAPPLSWFKRGLDYALSAYIKPNVEIAFQCNSAQHRSPAMAYAFKIALGFDQGYARECIMAAVPGASDVFFSAADDAVERLGYC